MHTLKLKAKARYKRKNGVYVEDRAIEKRKRETVIDM